MFRVLSDIHLGPGLVRIIPITQNTKKQDPFGIYVGFGSVRIYFYRIGFGSDFRVRFICPALIWTKKTNILSNLIFSLTSIFLQVTYPPILFFFNTNIWSAEILNVTYSMEFWYMIQQKKPSDPNKSSWPSGKRLTAVSTVLGSIFFGHLGRFKW